MTLRMLLRWALAVAMLLGLVALEGSLTLRYHSVSREPPMGRALVGLGDAADQHTLSLTGQVRIYRPGAEPPAADDGFFRFERLPAGGWEVRVAKHNC